MDYYSRVRVVRFFAFFDNPFIPKGAMGRSAEEMVMVGDTTHDIYMSHAFGCPCIAVSYGAMTTKMLEPAQPDAICASVAELAQSLGM